MTPEELANRMARHIIGSNLLPKNEACRECIKIAREAINEAYEDAARFFDALQPDIKLSPPSIAAAIRARIKD